MTGPMKGTISSRRLISIAALVAAWCFLWATISIANIVSGTAIAIAVTSPSLATAGSGGVRLRPLLRLIWMATVDLAKSTVIVATEIITPKDRTKESIVAVKLPSGSRHHLLLLVVAITLTPGTAVVDTDPDAGILYLHLLHDQNRAKTIEHVVEFANLACQALPVSTIGTTT